jgi:hypothetical protein
MVARLYAATTTIQFGVRRLARAGNYRRSGVKIAATVSGLTSGSGRQGVELPRFLTAAVALRAASRNEVSGELLVTPPAPLPTHGPRVLLWIIPPFSTSCDQQLWYLPLVEIVLHDCI